MRLAFIDASGYEVEEEYRIYIAGVYIRTQKEKEVNQPCNQFTATSEIDYKVTKKVNKVDDDLEAVTHLMKEFKKGAHEVVTMVYNGKTYTYNDKGELTINENL